MFSHWIVTLVFAIFLFCRNLFSKKRKIDKCDSWSIACKQNADYEREWDEWWKEVEYGTEMSSKIAVVVQSCKRVLFGLASSRNTFCLWITIIVAIYCVSSSRWLHCHLFLFTEPLWMNVSKLLLSLTMTLKLLRNTHAFGSHNRSEISFTVHAAE